MGDFPFAIYRAAFLTGGERELLEAMATDWAPVLDSKTKKPNGEYRAATLCQGLDACKPSRRRSLGCMLEPEHHERHPEKAICAGYLRTLPAWEQWTMVVQSARIATDRRTLPHLWVLAERFYSANLK